MHLNRHLENDFDAKESELDFTSRKAINMLMTIITTDVMIIF